MIDLINTYAIALELVNISYIEAEKKITKLVTLEREFDMLYRTYNLYMFKKSLNEAETGEKFIPYSVYILLKEIMDLIEDAADIIDHAGELVRILGLKHRI